MQYRNRSIDSNGFTNWHKDHMYRSSYANFHSKVNTSNTQDSVNPKCTAIPGYGGYIPYVKPENIHGKGYTPIAKQSFSQDKLAKNIMGLSTTGFNLNRDALIDSSKFGSTSKYGRTAIQRPHPGWNVIF